MIGNKGYRTILVCNNIIICDPTLVFQINSKNSINLKFNFVKKWDDDLILYAKFVGNNDKIVFTKIDENYFCYVPHEVLEKGGYVSIRVVGVKFKSLEEKLNFDEEIDIGSLESIEKKYNILRSSNSIKVAIV